MLTELADVVVRAAQSAPPEEARKRVLELLRESLYSPRFLCSLGAREAHALRARAEEMASALRALADALQREAL